MIENEIQAIEYVAALRGIPQDGLMSGPLPDGIPGYMVWQQFRGGYTVLVAPDSSTLGFPSGMNPEEEVQNFKNGMRDKPGNYKR
jgi:hypothetical protein